MVTIVWTIPYMRNGSLSRKMKLFAITKFEFRDRIKLEGGVSTSPSVGDVLGPENFLRIFSCGVILESFLGRNQFFTPQKKYRLWTVILETQLQSQLCGKTVAVDKHNI
jgi:hypothetical protein